MRNKPKRDPLSMSCWIWERARDARGYGAICRNGSLTGAHRFVYEALVGPIPDGLELDHLCRNPACVNPDHLEPVTHRVNTQRGANGRLGHERAAAIRSQHAAGSSRRDLALRYGVSTEAIRLVVNGITWGTD